MGPERSERGGKAGRARSVLVLQSGALGDCVLQLRVAEALRRAWPDARIAWVGRDAWLPLARRCDCLDESFGADALRLHRLFTPDPPMDADLVDLLGSFELIVNGMAGADSALAAHVRRLAASGAITYETRPRPGCGHHVCRQWLERIAAQLEGVSPEAAGALRGTAASLENESAPLLRAQPEDCTRAAQSMVAAGVVEPGAVPIALIHPGSGGAHKCWPLENYIELGRLLAERGYRPVPVLGPAEAERWSDPAGWFRGMTAHMPAISDLPLEVLIGLLGLAAVYVGNDSGPTHLAAAMGTATVAVFGPTDARVWRPLGPRVVVLRSQRYEHGWTDAPPEQVAQSADGLARS